METRPALKLPNEEKIMDRLLTIGGTADLEERFYPLLTKYAGKEATMQNVKDWLAGAIGEYVATLPVNARPGIRRLMYKNAGRFIDAIVEEKTTASEIKDYFRTALSN